MSNPQLKKKNAPVLECDNIKKTYQGKAETIVVLNKLSLDIYPGERVAIIGSSGSGKTTLLNILAGLDRPDSGNVLINGKLLNQQGDKERSVLRNKKLGFVFQFHHLLAEFTALENVSMPLLTRSGISIKKITSLAEKALENVGLSQRTQHKPAELSGGERQRVAIARALVTEPDLVLMDEPTGNLDHHTAHAIHDLALSLSHQLSTSFIIVTHDQALAAKMDKIYSLEDGKLHVKTSS